MGEMFVMALAFLGGAAFGFVLSFPIFVQTVRTQTNESTMDSIVSSSMEKTKGSTDQIITITYASGKVEQFRGNCTAWSSYPDAVSVRSLSLRSHLHQIWQRKTWKISDSTRGGADKDSPHPGVRP